MILYKRAWHASQFLWLVFLCLNDCLTISPLANGADPAIETQRFALLIGVGKYPGLSPSEQLDGCVNDVAAMRQLLTERFGFSEQNITTLIDQQATGDEIRKAMRELSLAVSKISDDITQAEVVIHFSGHGSQLPDQPSGPDHDEDDGLDETWVPFDATKQGGQEDIRDDEIHTLIRSICENKKVRLLVVADCCHSGTGIRGATKFRKLNRDFGQDRAASSAPIIRKQVPASAVFLSACRDREVEPEFQKDNKSYGLLTRFLVQTLSEEQAVSKLTYVMLQEAIVAGYLREGVMRWPTPQLEGEASAIKSSVLGFGKVVDLPPYFSVESTSATNRVLLRAGNFHHITVGSLFNLHERPEQIAGTSDKTDSSLAWLRISRVDATTSEGQVFRWEDEKRAKPVEHTLPESFLKGYAMLQQREPDDVGLRVKVVSVNGDASDSPPLAPEDPQMPKVLTDMLSQANKPGESQWLKWTTEKDLACDMLLKIDGSNAAVFPATGMAEVAHPPTKTRGDVPTSLLGGWGPIDVHTGKDRDDPSRTLIDYLRNIARVRNLVSLAQAAAANSSTGYRVKLELLRVEESDENDRALSSKPWEPNKEAILEVQENAHYCYRVTNQDANKPVYVTLLEISPNMGIQAMLPIPQGDPLVRLEPGAKYESNAYACGPVEEGQPFTPGTFYAIMLVTREPADFRFVTLPELPRTRGSLPFGGAGSLSEQLAESAFFQPRQTRGGPLKRKQMDTTWYAKVLTWKAIQ